MRLLIVTQVVDSEHSNLGFFHGWIEEFAKQCESVHVVCLQEGRHRLPDNVEVYSLGKEKGTSRVVRLLRFFAYITGPRRGYDAVFVHMNPEYIVLGGLLWRLWGKKTGLWYVHKSVTLWLRIAVFFANVIFTASSESFRAKTKKLRILGHGIDTSRFAPRAESRSDVLRIITVGRISASKHLKDMLDVVDELAKRSVAFTFTLVGAPLTAADVVYEKELRSAVAAKPYAVAVTFTGAVPYAKIPGLLSGADVMLHMSTTGSVDKAVLDALAAGTFVVSTSEAFSSEMPGVTGVKDVPGAAHALEHLPQVSRADVQTYIYERHSLKRLISRIIKTLV